MEDREKLETITPEDEEDDGDMLKVMRGFVRWVQEVDFDEKAFEAGLQELAKEIGEEDV